MWAFVIEVGDCLRDRQEKVRTLRQPSPLFPAVSKLPAGYVRD